MNRVETLILKLQEQLSQQAPVDQLLLTVQMLQAELMHIRSNEKETAPENTAIIDMPVVFEAPAREANMEVPPEKTMLVLEVDEEAIEAELEEIKRNVKAREQISIQNKPPLLFDPVEDIPTLIHQDPAKDKPKELHEAIGQNQSSLNDKLKQAKFELSDALQEVPVKDLKKAIGINDRFLFIKELFKGDEVMYERSIKTINGFSIFPEAEYWIKRELKLKLSWDESSQAVKQFDQLIRRRFLSI